MRWTASFLHDQVGAADAALRRLEKRLQPTGARRGLRRDGGLHQRYIALLATRNRLKVARYWAVLAHRAALRHEVKPPQCDPDKC